MDLIELQHLLPRTPLDSFLAFSQPVSTILVGDLFDQIYTNYAKWGTFRLTMHLEQVSGIIFQSIKTLKSKIIEHDTCEKR